jgi:AraC-like DNA-binding protein
MEFRVHRPAFPLSQYVELIWRTTTVAAPGGRQRVYPDGAMGLFIDLDKPVASFSTEDEDYSVRAPLLAGPWSRSFFVDASERTSAVGVVFRPGGASRFFPIRADELHNADVALSDLDSGEADRLLNDVCASADATAQFLAVEQFLKGRLRDATPIHPAVTYSVDQLWRVGGVRRVGEIQRQTGLSHTRFIQLFRAHVGLTPKLFCRIRRFRALLDRIRQGMPVNWAELAADCGYYDQAHLIRDFRAFAGLTPGEYSRTMHDQDSRLLVAT